MSILLAVVAAFAAVTLTTHFSQQSALALGKVSSVLSATAVLADAWSKTQAIARRHRENPTSVSLPTTQASSPALPVPVRRAEPVEDEFFAENPSLRLTGGIRGYSAYAPFDR